jgi:hypothetical protein
MRQIGLFFILLSSVVFCSCQKESAKEPAAIKLSIRDDYTFEYQDEVVKFLKVFLNSRPSIQKNLESIDFAEARLMNLNKRDYAYEDYGWTKQIYIEIKLKDNTGLPKNWRVDGQKYIFFLGSGNNPGAIAHFANNEKPFTDLPVYNNEETLTSIPALVGIDMIGGTHDPEQVGKITIAGFIFAFKLSVDFWVWAEAGNYFNPVDNNSNPIEIRSDEIGRRYVIRLYYDDTSKVIKKATFSYKYDGTKYQQEMSSKLFFAFVSTMEMARDEEEGEKIIDLVRKIYNTKNGEVLMSNRGNTYSSEIKDDDFIYYATTPYQ